MRKVPGRRPLRYACAMELSARNQLKGTVKRVAADGVMAEVVVDIGGPEIVSTITKASADRLKLKAGDAVVVVVKASDVIVGK
jgi:molybdopterin-binding protein